MKNYSDKTFGNTSRMDQSMDLQKRKRAPAGYGV